MTKTKESTERGMRLRSLREQTGLTRSQFAREVNISEHTLKSFELGTRELPIQKAREYSRIFLFAGIDVSFEFLYYGKEPERSENVIVDDNLNIQNEVIFFKKNNPSSIIYTVPDTLMSPFYNKGDIVGGQKITNELQFPLFTGQVCIIEDTSSNQCLRRIIRADKKIVTVCTLGTEEKNLHPTIEEIEVYSMAQVTRHWHVFELIRDISIQASTKPLDFSLSTS
jgi:transcriptional regulator with XRE-family HTH domain